jgi:hypothetical protein
LRLYACYVGGVVLFCLALYLAQRFDLSPNLRTDLQGVVAQGSAERLQEGLYRLTYTHPSGTVFSRTYKGRVSVPDPKHATPLRIVYNPNNPQEFQPSGISYVPAVFVTIFTALGAGLVFYANNRLVRQSIASRRR